MPVHLVLHLLMPLRLVRLLVLLGRRVPVARAGGSSSTRLRCLVLPWLLRWLLLRRRLRRPHLVAGNHVRETTECD